MVICARFVGILLIKHRAIKRGRMWTKLVFTDTILAVPFCSIKSGREQETTWWRRDAATVVRERDRLGSNYTIS